MKIKHYVVNRFQNAKKVPLWKWIVVILVVIAMPLFFLYVNIIQTQQAVNIDNQMLKDKSAS